MDRIFIIIESKNHIATKMRACEVIVNVIAVDTNSERRLS